jgi:membrane dipeptidase
MKARIHTPGHRIWPSVALMLGAAFLLYQLSCCNGNAYTNEEERVQWLTTNFPIIDTHNDLPWALRSRRAGSLNMTELPKLDTDLIRMKKGHLTAQIWSAFIPCEEDYNARADYIIQTLEQIDIIKRLIAENDDLVFAERAKDIEPAFKKGKIPSLIGIEGGHQIDSSLAALRQFYALGVRYMTLTHVCHTPWADSCAPTPVHNGLTSFGKQIVIEMNRLGMMVDISHVSHKVMQDVVALSKAPLFASHSSSYALCPTTRNIPDEILEAMKVKDGVIMVNFWPALISCSHTATVDQVIEHFKHIAKVAGPEHIGFGGDFDGITEKTTGLEDVSTYPKLVKALVKSGFTDDQIIGIMGGNLIRVLKKTEQVAKEFREMYPDPTVIQVNRTNCLLK